MIDRTNTLTAAAFDAWVQRAENEDRLFELLDGEMVEKVPSNAFASEIAQLVAFFIRLFLRENRIAGHVTDGQGGYIVAGERFAPDVAYISAARQPELASEGYNPNPPELAVEVEHPTSEQSERRLRKKLSAYLAAGTVVWVIYAMQREVEVYVPGQVVRTLTISDTLTGGDVLPGFSVAIKEIFPSQRL